MIEPVEGAPVVGDEVEEIGAPENEDPSMGRTGSVCDVRRPSSNKPTSADKPSPPTPNVQKETRRQQTQLDELLRAPPVTTSSPMDAETYAALRGRRATLSAFERKLRRLLEEALDRCKHNLSCIHALDVDHPDYAGRYRETYNRASPGPLSPPPKKLKWHLYGPVPASRGGHGSPGGAVRTIPGHPMIAVVFLVLVHSRLGEHHVLVHRLGVVLLHHGDGPVRAAGRRRRAGAEGRATVLFLVGVW